MATRVTLVKRFTYRGNPNEQFSNTYSLRGTTPADNAAWDTLVGLLAAQEKTCYHAGVSIVKAYCYTSDDPHAATVHVVDYSGAPIAGTLSTASSNTLAGDQAAWVRWKTPRLTSKGKPIYLRKYFHGGIVAPATPPAPQDTVMSTWRTALLAFGTKLMDGTLATDRTITGPGFIEDMVAREASTYITVRTLKRRGKRPPTGP